MSAEERVSALLHREIMKVGTEAVVSTRPELPFLPEF